MILSFWDWVIIIGFLALFLYIGISYRKAASKGLESFFLGGRNLPWYIAGTSMVATTFAADTPLAVTELVAKNGVSGNWLWWCFLTGGMLTTFFFAKYWRRAEIVTELELIDLRYSGREAKFLRLFKSVYLGLFMNAMIIAWVNLAFVSILTVFLGLPEETALWVTFATMIIALIYSSASGLLGVAITDMIQFAIAMLGCIILAVLVINSDEVGGMQNLKSSLPSEYFSFFPSLSSGNVTTTLSLSIGAFLSFFAVQWWASWYPGAEPGGGGYIAQRMMSVKNEKDAVFSTLFFQIAHYGIRPWPWIIVGIAAVYLYGGDYIDNANPESVAAFADKPRMGFVFAMRDFLPAGLKGLLFVAFLSAYLSTISTQLNWGASFIVNDFLIPLKVVDKKDQKTVFWSRLTTLLLMIAGVLVTTMIESISGVWEFILQCGAGLGLVLILRWYWWRINAWSEIAALIAPFFGYAISSIFIENIYGELYTQNNGTFLFTVAFTTISWLGVTFLTAATKTEKLDSFYHKVKPNGWWPQNKGRQNGELKNLFVCWVTSVILIYSFLFSVGSFIFLNYFEGVIWLLSSLINYLLLVKFMKKAELI